MKRLLPLFVVLFAVSACKKEPAPPVNHAPVAVAGADATVIVGDSVALEGSGTDEDGDTLTFAWAVVSAPTGSSATIENPTQPPASFAPDVEGAYTVSLTVNDGELDSEPDTLSITAEKAPFISGSVTVTVVDFDTGDALEGATVYVGSPPLTATTGANGTVVVEDASLDGAQTITVEGPGTVDVDHDLDAATPDEARPAYRRTTIQGAIRSELTVPLRRSGSAVSTDARGTVRGRIDLDIFDLLPTIDPFLSLDSTEVTSEQLRAVIIAPVIDRALTELDVRDLLGPPLTSDAVLPGNLTSDDPFITAVAGQIGIPVDNSDPIDREYPMTKFAITAPAGTTRFFVLGAIIGVDTSGLVPVLIGGGDADVGAILGSLELVPLFVGLFDVAVPAGGELVLDTPIGVPALTNLMMVDADITFETTQGPWALNPTTMVDYNRAVITPRSTAGVTAHAAIADPRVAANLPATWDVEITNPDGSSQQPPVFATLDVPAQTGDPDTTVPYSLALALAETSKGFVPFGLSFTRGPGVALAAASFGLPDLTTALSGAPLTSITLSPRGLSASAIDGAFIQLPGAFVSKSALSAGAVAESPTPTPIPAVTDPADAGLRVSLTLERSDTTSTTIDSARAAMSGMRAPSVGTHELGDTVAVTTGGGGLLRATLSLRTWATLDPGTPEQRLAPVDDALWDIYADVAADVTLTLPTDHGTAMFAAGQEVTVEIRTESYASPLDMERWSGARIMTGPASFSTDLYRALAR